MNFKTVAVVIVAGVALAGGAYYLGTRQASAPVVQAQAPAPAEQAPAQPAPANETGATAQQALLPPAQDIPTGHPATGAFTQFQVGNRNVKSIYSDGDIVWIGTSGGVVRYNVKTNDYKLFNVESGSLLSNGVFHVSRLGDQIAVGTYGGGVSFFNPANEKWKNYNIQHGLADQFVYDVVKAANGDVWIATWSGANRVRGGRFDDRSAWDTFTVASTKGGLPNDWVYGLELGKNGDIWLATEGGLALYRDGKWFHWAHADGLGAAYEKVKDDIKFTNDPGKASKHHARQKTEQGLENVNIAYNPNYIISMVVDTDGIVWAGTWGGGLARFDGKSWRNYTVKEGLPANHIFMLHLDPKGMLWIGTSRGLARFTPDHKGFTVKTSADGLFSDNVFSMAEARDGSVWVGSFGGVTRFNTL